MNRDSQIAAVSDLVTPVLASLGLECFDLHFTGSGRARTLQVMVERAGEGAGSVDLDTIALAAQALTPVLDESPALTGPYVLEVTSPGVERPLRRPDHFRRARGEVVSVKYRRDGASQRMRGSLVTADDTTITVEADGKQHQISYDDIVDARTVFEWGPTPRPGGSGKRGRAQQPARKKETSRS